MENSISYKHLSIIVISFILGIVTVLIIENYLLKEKIEFDTLGLIGFIFSIVFAGASIVLAITAINLGKSSEKLMIERSDKSIELQNEVYIKTTEALKQIESSTGVTEKRIEDIIAGRVGNIVNTLVDDKIVPQKDRERVERELRRSLSKEMSETEKIMKEEEIKYREEIDKKYDAYKENVLLNLANLTGSKTLRLADGSYTNKGVGLLDGLYEINNVKIGICSFYSDQVYENVWGSAIDKFVNNLAEEISNKTFSKVFLAFNDSSNMTDKFNVEIEKIKKLLKPEISDGIILLTGSPDEITNEITKYAP